MIRNWFRKDPEKKKYKGFEKKKLSKKEERKQEEDRKNNRSAMREADSKATGYQVKESDSKQEQIDGLLDNLQGHLGKLNLQAKDIGREIDEQNDMLEQLDNHMEVVNDKMTKQSHDVNKMLK